MNDAVNLMDWLGRTETAVDVAASAPLAGLAALLDHAEPPWISAEVAPLGHWLYFLPHARQSQMGADGHPHRGGFLPPVPLPRRMWAGSRVRFESPIPIGAIIERRSTIADIAIKAGKSGSMVFVTLLHEICVAGHRAIREEQDIVYREMPGIASGAGGASASASANSAGGTAPTGRTSQWTRTIQLDPVQLFRFSALTFNAHRIHYDRQYTREVEGYPDLVVHGPFAATLLMDHFLQRFPRTRITGFSFRAQRPLFASSPFDVCLDAGERSADLWAIDKDGQTAMVVTIHFEPRV
jgi:3-methylfumaryl-CoA hydratase